jgi:hypothetical protein
MIIIVVVIKPREPAGARVIVASNPPTIRSMASAVRLGGAAAAVRPIENGINVALLAVKRFPVDTLSRKPSLHCEVPLVGAS